MEMESLSIKGDAVRSEVSDDRRQLSSTCRFRCEPCNEVFHNWTSTTTHLRRKHGNDREFGKRNKFDIDKYVIERHHHTCSLCGKEVLQDLKVLSSHLGGAHKMPLSKYKQLQISENANLQPQSQTRQETTARGEETEDKTSEKADEEDKDSPKMDPRVLNLDMVKSLMKEESFECRICGRHGARQVTPHFA